MRVSPGVPTRSSPYSDADEAAEVPPDAPEPGGAARLSVIVQEAQAKIQAITTEAARRAQK